MSALHCAQGLCVPCTGHLYRSRATSCRVLFRSSGEQLWLPVNVLGSRSRTYADTLKRNPGTPRVRSKVCRSSTSSDGDIKTARAQELQSKARLLRKQQEELAEQVQRLNEESESLSATDQKLVQAELSSQVYKMMCAQLLFNLYQHKCFPAFIAAY